MAVFVNFMIHMLILSWFRNISIKTIIYANILTSIRILLGVTRVHPLIVIIHPCGGPAGTSF